MACSKSHGNESISKSLDKNHKLSHKIKTIFKIKEKKFNVEVYFNVEVNSPYVNLLTTSFQITNWGFSKAKNRCWSCNNHLQHWFCGHSRSRG